MTQKPPEKEIWAISREERQTYVRISCSTLNHDGEQGCYRYILAAPKEDVERALNTLQQIEERINSLDGMYSWGGEIETIRRVLMANAGRG